MTVKEARETAGLSQEKVAKELNMSFVSYNRKENGKAKWTYEQAKRFSEIVNVHMWLIEFR